MSSGSALTRQTLATRQSKKSGKSVASKSSKGSKRQDECGYHRYGKLDLYCVDHKCLICSYCRQEEHEHCRNVIPVDQAAINFSQTSSATDCDKLLRKLLVQCTSVVYERRKDQEELKRNKTDIELYVHNFRQSMIEKLDAVVHDILEEVDGIYRREHDDIVSNVSELMNTIKVLEDKLADIEIAKTVSADLPLFMAVQTAIDKHANIKSSLSSIHDKAHNVSLKLKRSGAQITNFTIGTLEVEKKPYAILPRQSVATTITGLEKKLAVNDDSRIRLVENVNVRASDEGTCFITGIQVFHDNFITLTDNNNNNIKLLSPKFQLVHTLPLNYPPFDLALTSDADIAVTSPETNEIILVGVFNREILEHNGSVKLKHDCYGIGVLDSYFFITSVSEKCVKMINMNGDEILTIKDDGRGQPLFVWPWYLTIDKQTKMIYVSDRNRNGIFELQNSGTYLKFVEMKETGPRGITSDGRGNLLVCSFMKDAVEVQSTDIFQEISMIGSKRDGIKHPQYISLLNKQPKFVLSSYNSDTLRVYEFLN